MKISEARQLYNAQIAQYREQQVALSKQKQELEKKMNATPDGNTVYANEAAILELTMKAVDEKQTADNTEAFSSGPVIVDVAETMAAAVPTE